MARDPLVLIVTMKGTPHGLPRPRFVKGHRRPVSITGPAKSYATALTAAARAVVLNVGDAAVQQEFAAHALSVSILWQFPTPHAGLWGQPHTRKPDKDNLEKLDLDCLQRSGALGGDDCRVAMGLTEKIWSRKGGVAIRVEVATRAKVREARKDVKARLAAPPPWLA